MLKLTSLHQGAARRSGKRRAGLTSKEKKKKQKEPSITTEALARLQVGKSPDSTCIVKATVEPLQGKKRRHALVANGSGSRTAWAGEGSAGERTTSIPGDVSEEGVVLEQGGARRRWGGRPQACSLKAPWAALEAALAAAACTVLLDMTPVANSCWALSKLAPVVRYSAWTW